MTIKRDTKLEGYTWTLTYKTAPEAGMNGIAMSAKVDLSDTTFGEILDLAQKSVVIKRQVIERKKGEKWMNEHTSFEGKLSDFVKSIPKVVNVSAMSPKELVSQMSPEQKLEAKRAAIQDMVDNGQAEWVDEEALTFQLVG